MKTPISYYGGKQMMASHIIRLFPPHNLYCEPFFGGGAVFFMKEPSPVEVINDHDERVINFYRICKTNFDFLKDLIDQTPHSKKMHEESEHVLRNPVLYSPVKQAWAFWAQTNMSFGSCIYAGFGYGRKKNSSEKKLMNKRKSFTLEYQQRLDCVQIECRDALKVIDTRDCEEAFFYCDPPYFNAVMGHYGGYTRENFMNLLEVLSNIKGKFLLSSYDSTILQEYIKRKGWYSIKKEMNLCMANKGGKNKKKNEMLTANYNILDYVKEE